MRKKVLAMLAGLFLLQVLTAAEIEILEIKNDNSFDQVVNYWCANEGMMKHRPGGAISREDGGITGACMKISNTEESLTALYSRALMPVETSEDVFKLSFYVKGKGKFRVGFYTYSKEKKFISTFFSPPTSPDSTDWVRQNYTIPVATLRGEVGNVRIAIEVPPGLAELYFDDFSGHRETPLPEQ
ncbi:MAG TPA: hypothetical protein PKY10_02490 [Lentisphaeria bacterium]|nr:hypothetical protein [Lentisphaeria bacterium]